jgi:hypothetical protein
MAPCPTSSSPRLIFNLLISNRIVIRSGTQTPSLARPKVLSSFRFLLRSGGSRQAPTVTPLLFVFVSHPQQVALLLTGVNVSEPIYTLKEATKDRPPLDPLLVEFVKALARDHARRVNRAAARTLREETHAPKPWNARMTEASTVQEAEVLEHRGYQIRLTHAALE